MAVLDRCTAARDHSRAKINVAAVFGSDRYIHIARELEILHRYTVRYADKADIAALVRSKRTFTQFVGDGMILTEDRAAEGMLVCAETDRSQIRQRDISVQLHIDVGQHDCLCIGSCIAEAITQHRRLCGHIAAQCQDQIGVILSRRDRVSRRFGLEGITVFRNVIIVREVTVNIVIIRAGDIRGLIAAGIDHIAIRTVEVVIIFLDRNADCELAVFTRNRRYAVDLIVLCRRIAGHVVRAVRVGCRRRHAARAALVGHQRARIALLCEECSRVAAGIQLNADIAAVDDHDTGRRVVRLRLRAQRAGIAAIRKLCGNRTGGKADDTADIAVAAAGIGLAFRDQLAAVRAIRKGCRRILIRADTCCRAVADTHIKGTSLDRTLIVAVLKGGRF